MANPFSKKPRSRTPETAQDLETVRARQRVIGNQLRGLYDDVVQEGVPDEFDSLLDQLEEQERKEDNADKRPRAALERRAS